MDDDIGVYDEDAQGNPVYNFSYIDQIFDGLLANGVRPFVEISFMPKKFASSLDYHAFWYKQIVSSPKDYSRWDAPSPPSPNTSSSATASMKSPADFESERAQHRFLDRPPRPADLLRAVRPHRPPPQEASTRASAGRPRHRTGRLGRRHDRPCRYRQRAARLRLHERLRQRHLETSSATTVPFRRARWSAPESPRFTSDQGLRRPPIPLIWSEFNATYANEQPITDSIYMGPWLADTIRQRDGKVDIMSYWTFSDVFEEQGVIRHPSTEVTHPSPSATSPARLPRLRNSAWSRRPAHRRTRTRRPRHAREERRAGHRSMEPREPAATGPDRTFTLDIKGAADRHVTIRRVDAAHGDTLTAWKNMDSLRYSTQAQIAALKKASEIGAPETISLHGDHLTVTVPPRAWRWSRFTSAVSHVTAPGSLAR